MNEPIDSISIPSTSTQGSYTLYNISIKLSNSSSYILLKRYSEFNSLNSNLIHEIKSMGVKSSLGSTPPYGLPPKDLSVYLNPNNETIIKKRREELEKYLKAILLSKDSRWRRCRAWLEFLEIPKDLWPSKDSKNPSSSVYNLVHSNDTFYNASQLSHKKSLGPREWMEEYDKSQEILRAIRNCIQERNRLLGSISSNSIANSQVHLSNGKKHLSSLEFCINLLENSLNDIKSSAISRNDNNSSNKNWIQSWVEDQKDTLKRGFFSSSNENLDFKKNKGNTMNVDSQQDNSKEISEQEYNRRLGLLVNLKKDYKDLSNQLNIDKIEPNSISNTYNNALNSSSFAADKESLLSSNRRKFGVKAPVETDITRPLNNSQVLQLQTQLMDEQDQLLDQLSVTINRQKEIGLAINEELEYQNKFLENLDEKLDRVSSNLKVGDKKLGRILKG